MTDDNDVIVADPEAREALSGSDRSFRLQWARYFANRARWTRGNADRQFTAAGRQAWLARALVEEECAMILDMLHKPLSDLHGELDC